MIGGDGHGFIFGRYDDGAPGQMVGLSEEPSGTLMENSRPGETHGVPSS